MTDNNPLTPFAEKYFKKPESGNPLEPFAKKYFGEAPQQPVNNDGNLLTDTGTDLKAGILKVPGMVTGLADIPAGLMGADRPFDKATDAIGEATGFTPGKWAKEAQKTGYSKERQQSDQNVQQAWEGYDKGEKSLAGAVGETLSNPRTLLGNTVESLPSMVVGGIGGKALLGARALAPAVGEGAVMSGQQMDNIDSSVDPQKAAALSLGTGAVGAGLGYAGGKVAQKMGWADPESVIGGVAQQSGKPTLSLPKRVAGGAASEGLLEELPQSVVEQGAQNVAEDKPLTQDMARSAVQGALSGGLMGGAFNVVKVSPTTGEEIPPETENSGPLGSALNAGAIALPKSQNLPNDKNIVFDDGSQTSAYDFFNQRLAEHGNEQKAREETYVALNGKPTPVIGIPELVFLSDGTSLSKADVLRGFMAQGYDEQAANDYLKKITETPLEERTTVNLDPYRFLQERDANTKAPPQPEATPTGDIPTAESAVSPQPNPTGVNPDEEQNTSESTEQNTRQGQERLLNDQSQNPTTQAPTTEEALNSDQRQSKNNKESNSQANQIPESWKSPTTEDDDRWYGTRIENIPQFKNEKPMQGTVRRVYMGSSTGIIEFQPDGSDSIFRLRPDQIGRVISFEDSKQVTEQVSKKQDNLDSISTGEVPEKSTGEVKPKTGKANHNAKDGSKEEQLRMANITARIAILHGMNDVVNEYTRDELDSIAPENIDAVGDYLRKKYNAAITESQLNKDQASTNASLPRYIENKSPSWRKSFGVDDAVNYAKTPSPFTKDSLDGKPIEHFLAQTHLWEDEFKNLDGRLLKGGKAAQSISSKDLIENWRNYAKAKLTIEAWEKSHPEEARKLQDRIDAVKALNVSDKVLIPAFIRTEQDSHSPQLQEATIVKKNPKNWLVKSSSGVHMHFRPEALSPVTAPPTSTADPSKNPVETLKGEINDWVTDYFGTAAYLGDEKADKQYVEKFVDIVAKYDNEKGSREKYRTVAKRLLSERRQGGEYIHFPYHGKHQVFAGKEMSDLVSRLEFNKENPPIQDNATIPETVTTGNKKETDDKSTDNETEDSNNESDKVDSRKELYQKLYAISKRIGVVVNSGVVGFKAHRGELMIPAEDKYAYGADVNTIFAHELGHAVLQKRGISYWNFSRADLKKQIGNWDDLVTASKDFRPLIWNNENKAISNHARKPDEIIVDAIASVFVGKNDISLLKGLPLNEYDLGLKSYEASTETKAGRDTVDNNADNKPVTNSNADADTLPSGSGKSPVAKDSGKAAKAKSREDYLNEPDFMDFIKATKGEFKLDGSDTTMPYEWAIHLLDERIAKFKGFIACMG